MKPIKALMFLRALTLRDTFKWTTSLLLSLSSVHLMADQFDSFPPRAHSAWVYDVLNRPGASYRNDPGFFSEEINQYNRIAGDDHKIRAIYTYLGSVEMYCPGRNPENCKENNFAFTMPEPKPGGREDRRASEDNTLSAYSRKVDPELANGRAILVAVVDGVVNADYEGSMYGFNELSREQAEILADKVSHRICSEPLIEGVQFDIEPFDIGTSGQYYFYKRIASNFADKVKGINGSPDTHCVDEDHPNGRFFSVFAPSHQLKPGTTSAENIQSVFKQNDNGYIIAPLYDLGSGSAGHLLSLDEYEKRANRHAKQMQIWARKLGVQYKFAIPVSATVHEYATCSGPACKDSEGDSNRSQLQYTKAALSAIEKSGARDDDLFLGNAVWAWSRGIIHHGSRFEPSIPPKESRVYLSRNL